MVDEKEKVDKVDREQVKVDKIKKVREEEAKIFESLKDSDYKSLVSDAYVEMDSYISMVIKGISTGCLIEGAGGTGKTYRAINECLKAGVDMAYTDSFTTPTAFYIWLFKNKDKDVIICDDVSGFLSNDKILSFLKGCLWAVNGHRLVNYMTTKPLKDEFDEYIENSFDMNARIIIITNFVDKKKPHISAVLTRINYCQVILDRDELLKVLEQIVVNPYDDLTLDERNECLSFLRENTSGSTKDLNIRTLYKVFMFKEYNKTLGSHRDFWKTLSLNMLKKDDRLVVVENIIDNDEFETEDARVKKFTELTGDSRATYYRLKKILDKRRSKNKVKEIDKVTLDEESD